MSEEPNTKLYFDKKIARVVFEYDEERKVYWFDMTDVHPLYIPHHNYHLHHLRRHHHIPYYLPFLLPIEEWLKEQGMTCVEDDMCLFELTWL